MKNFSFKTAINTKEAVKLFSNRSAFLAGGMTLLPAIKLGLATYANLINIKGGYGVIKKLVIINTPSA